MRMTAVSGNAVRVLLSLALCTANALAQTTKAFAPPSLAPDAKPLPQASAGTHSLDPADVGAFFDGIVPLQLERSDIAGASVLVMQGDRVLLEKGYGFADDKKRVAVDPAKTIFRLASISKLFTWVSVMQLAEQGKLDIDADINRYLDFEIHPAFNKPVTLRNLMTHTGGFEEVMHDVIVVNPKAKTSLRDFLIRNQPNRLFAPGTVPGYSNYGVGLAGYVVERVSGEPFEAYVAHHIFTPLGMNGSTFYQPVPGDVSATPSEGYHGDSSKPPVGFEIFFPAPAGGLSSTAHDMGRFAQALLNHGTLDGHQILHPETLALMWTPQFRASDQMPPACMGFYQDWHNNTHWIGHEGDLIAFHSLFFLDPATNTTLFISYNSAGGSNEPRPELIDLFTDRYFPAHEKQAFISLSKEDLHSIEGTYETTRRADSTRARLLGLLGQTVAKVDKEGVLTITRQKDLRGHLRKFKPIAKDLWQEVDGQARIFFIRDSNGKVIRFAGDFAGVQRERVPWYENGKLIALLSGASFFTLFAVVVAPLFRMAKRIVLHRRPTVQPQPGTLWLPALTKLTALLWLLPISGMLYLGTKGDDMMPPTDAWNKWFILINIIIALALVMTLYLVISARRIWALPELRTITRIKFTVVALGGIILAYLALHFHLIGTLRI